MSQQISLKDVANYEFSHVIAADHGYGVSKSLYAIVKGCMVAWEVVNHKSKKNHRFCLLREAVKKYNAI